MVNFEYISSFYPLEFEEKMEMMDPINTILVRCITGHL